jgi:2-dehydropantoate 2-reductase
MRIAVMAAGAVGGYFGARLAAAGHDVAFVARGGHRDAIRANGLRIDSVLGNVLIKPAEVTDDPAGIGPVDIVLFAVKLWDTETAGELSRPLVGPNTRLITLQNGVDAVERLAPILGSDAVVGGIAYIATVIASPGVISQTSQFARMRCGRIDGGSDPQLVAFADAAARAGIDIAVSHTINRHRWEKFVFLTALAGITASTRMPIGPLRRDPDTRALFHTLMREVVAVGRAARVNLAEDFADEQLRFADTVPDGMKASMAHDLERGNRLELDWLAGTVVRLGRQYGLPTPANDAVYAILKPHSRGQR